MAGLSALALAVSSLVPAAPLAAEQGPHIKHTADEVGFDPTGTNLSSGDLQALGQEIATELESLAVKPDLPIAHRAASDGIIIEPSGEVVSLTVPAGQYLVTGRSGRLVTGLSGPSLPPADRATCCLYTGPFEGCSLIGNEELDVVRTKLEDTPSARFQAILDAEQPMTVKVHCHASTFEGAPGAMSVNETELVAVSVKIAP